MAEKISVIQKLYAEKEFVDIKILSQGKVFGCHKNVLSCQSEVFKTMIKNKTLIEKETGIMKIEENGISSESMEQFVYFLYHETLKDSEKISIELLMLADKYNISGLLDEPASWMGPVF